MTIKNDWVLHAEFFTLLIALVGAFYLIDGKIEKQCSRTDKLYEMYCQQQKEFDQRFYDLKNDSDRKFYDLLRRRG